MNKFLNALLLICIVGICPNVYATPLQPLPQAIETRVKDINKKMTSLLLPNADKKQILSQVRMLMEAKQTIRTTTSKQNSTKKTQKKEPFFKKTTSWRHSNYKLDGNLMDKISCSTKQYPLAYNL
jgi:hypothetical protein